MARSPHSLPGAHALAWSSPLLLLVLLFTVTARPTPTTTPSNLAATSTTPTTLAPSTTAPSTPASTTTTPRTTATTVTTARASERPSGAATASSARSSEHALNVSVASGALSGALSPGFADVVVPLRGPGRWSLVGSPTITATLNCPSVSGPVVGVVEISGAQSCQLEITSSDVRGLPTWQLTPVR